jgi:hypothetical protein
MIANRRKYVRIKSDECSCEFELDGNESTAVVVDESIEGIRISGVNLTRLSLDQPITIQHKGVTIVGRCRSISRNRNGSYRVGVLRASAAYVHKHKSFILNTFMRCSKFAIACTINETLGSDQLHVELLDGKTFVLDRDRVVKKTRDQRRAQLHRIAENEEKFDEIKAIYASMTGADFEEAGPDEVLDQEFGAPI